MSGHAMSPLLPRLRNEQYFCDGAIAVQGEEFKIHRVVIASVAPFFEKAFKGPFRESEERRIALRDTTKRAVETLIDFAYEVEVIENLRNDLELTLEVCELAHRCGVSKLSNTCASAVSVHKAVENAVNLYHKAKMYLGTEPVVEELKTFISRELASCAQTEFLTVDELDTILGSRELIATEPERASVVKRWVHANHKGRKAKKDSKRLWSHVRFELMAKNEIAALFHNETEWIPQSILTQALLATSGTLALSHQGELALMLRSSSRSSGYYHYRSECCYCSPTPNKPGRDRTTVVMDFNEKSKMFLRHHGWVLSLKKEGSCFRAQIERRWTTTNMEKSASFADAVKSCSFFVRSKLVWAKGSSTPTDHGKIACDKNASFLLSCADNNEAKQASDLNLILELEEAT